MRLLCVQCCNDGGSIVMYWLLAGLADSGSSENEAMKGVNSSRQSASSCLPLRVAAIVAVR